MFIKLAKHEFSSFFTHFSEFLSRQEHHLAHSSDEAVDAFEFAEQAIDAVDDDIFASDGVGSLHLYLINVHVPKK